VARLRSEWRLAVGIALAHVLRGLVAPSNMIQIRSSSSET